MNTTKEKRIFSYILAFVIPIVILLVGYYLAGIFPFGDKSILYRDLKGQYVSYFSEFRNAILGNGGLLYSFTKGLGGNMIGIVAYYLMSPFNIIILIFPQSMITEAILLITILKIALSGLTFMVFLKYTFKDVSYRSLIFSSAYALCGFITVYQSNIMWLDAVYLLPLVMIGINKIVNKEKKRVYIITLALTIITSFYTGFMVCIFSVMYFIYLTVIKIHNEKKEKKFFINRLKPFIVSSIISGLLSLFIILPTIVSLQNGKSKFAFFTDKLTTNFNFVNLFSKVYLNKIVDGNILSGLPSIYTGVLIIMLVILYFLNNKINLFEKVSSGIIIIIFILSLYINKIDYIWQGFNAPAGFPYRYTFIISFFLIILAYKAFINIKEVDYFDIIIVFIFMSLGLFYFYIVKSPLFVAKVIIANAGVIILYSIGLFLLSKGKLTNIITILLAIIFFGELGLNGMLTYKNLPYAKREAFLYYTKDVGKTMNYIQEEDKSFYRLDKDFYFNINDPMLLNYRGISHFSSMYNVSLKDLLNGFGFINNGYWMLYGKGSMLTANTLVNMKYVVTEEKKDMPGFKYLKEYNGMYIYENIYYLNAGFMVNDKIINDVIKPTDNPFESQNQIFKDMTNDEFSKLYYNIDNYKITLENLNEKSNDGNNVIYEKIDKKKKSELEITFIAQNDYPIYYFSQTGAKVSVNGEDIGGVSGYYYKTIGLGSYKKGEKVRVEIEPAIGTLKIGKNAFNYLNLDNFKEYYNVLKQDQLNVTSFKSNEIKGNIVVKDKGEILYTTIPYDKGWKLTINGEKADYEEVIGGLIGIKLNPGTYNIVLKFMPKGLIVGSLISLITLILGVIFALISDIKRNIYKKTKH